MKVLTNIIGKARLTAGTITKFFAAGRYGNEEAHCALLQPMKVLTNTVGKARISTSTITKCLAVGRYGNEEAHCAHL